MGENEKRPVSPINGVPLPRGMPFEPGDRAREIGRKGGKRSKQKQAERKTLREDLLAVLADMEIPQTGGGKIPVQEALSLSLIKAALSGNVRAYETIRDTVGEKPVENVNVVTADFAALDAAFQKAGEVVGADHTEKG